MPTIPQSLELDAWCLVSYPTCSHLEALLCVFSQSLLPEGSQARVKIWCLLSSCHPHSEGLGSSDSSVWSHRWVSGTSGCAFHFYSLGLTPEPSGDVTAESSGLPTATHVDSHGCGFILAVPRIKKSCTSRCPQCSKAPSSSAVWEDGSFIGKDIRRSLSTLILSPTPADLLLGYIWSTLIMTIHPLGGVILPKRKTNPLHFICPV